MIDSRGLAALLATTSLAALMAGGSGPARANGCGGGGLFITGTSSGATNPSGTTVPCIAVLGATVTGDVVNAGTVDPGGPRGIEVIGGSFTGAVVNSGTISAGSTGIVVTGISTFAGSISNSGVISAGPAGILVESVSLMSDGISNSGTVTGGGNGIKVSSVSRFAGGIVNNGTIGANFVHGIEASDVATFAGGISNGGTITSGSGAGIAVNSVTSFSGGITNSGTISGLNGITVAGGVTFSGPIVNTGTITGGSAIDVSNAPHAMTIEQRGGTIAGNIALSPFADDLNISGGAINGNVVGSGASNRVNFALGAGTFTYDSAFAISGVDRINVNSGLVIFNGSNSASHVTVNAGTLEVGDAAHSGATLAAGDLAVAGGTLMGHGTVIADIALSAGAVLAPGGSIGTLNVTGNLNFAPGTTYQVEVSPAGAASKTAVTGNAGLGGIVHVVQQPGTYVPPIPYVILTASGGVTGIFAGATSDLAFLTPVLGYDANTVFLTLTRNTSLFASLAQTANQHSTGAALDASPFASPLVQAVLSQTGAGARQAFDALSGEIFASLQSTLADDAHHMRQAMLGRLRQAGYAGAPGSLGALAFDGPVLAGALAYAPDLPTKAPPVAAPVAADVTLWAQGVGAWGRIAGDGNAADATRDLRGVFTGLDARFGEFARIGFAGGYSRSSLGIDARASSATTDTANLGLYGGATLGGVNLRAGGAYAFHTVDTSRAIAFPGFFDRTSAHFDASTAQAFGEVGYGLALGPVAAEPFAGLAALRVRTDAFAETGGAAALLGAGSAMDVAWSTLGLRLAGSVMLGDMALVPRATLAWQHAFGNLTPAAALAFASTGTAFTVTGVPLARDAALVEAGLDLRVTPRAKVGLSYSGELARQLRDQAVRGMVSWSF